MKLLTFEDFINEGKSLGKVFYKKMKSLNDQIESLKGIRKDRVKPYNIEKDPIKKEEIKQDLLQLTKQINAAEIELQKMREQELRSIEALDAGAELELTD